MKGTALIAEALSRCADTFYGVPGYPVTELAQSLNAEVTINEKTALEYALGDSLSGRRSAIILKNVGLNACADPLVNATTQGLIAGVVIVAGDDPFAQGSQNAQDSRYYGELAQVPVLEPDVETCSAAIAAAFEASEMFSRVAILRLTPQILDSDVIQDFFEPVRRSGALAPPNLTMRGRAEAAELRTAAMYEWSRNSPLNRQREGSVVAAGPGEGQTRIVTVYPPPAGLPGNAVIREIGRPFLSDHRNISRSVRVIQPETHHARGFYRTFCRECPFRSLMAILAKRKIPTICDVGCALLAVNPPYSIGKAGYALGSSVAIAARSTKVALIGDYALLHSGMNALIDVYEKKIPLLTIVMKNDRMGMTGGQRAVDPVKYIQWADPVTCDADNKEVLNDELVVPDTPRTLVVEGVCPEGCRHETVEC